MLDKELNRFLILFYLVSCVYSITVAFSQNLIEKPFDMEFLKMLLFAYFFVYGTKFLFIFFALIITKKFILDKISILPSIFIHIVICVIISFSATTLLIPFEKYIINDNKIDVVINWSTILERFVYRSDFNFFIYFSLTTFLYAFYYFKKQKTQELEHTIMKNQLLDSKIKSLQSQIHPHFLFNTLNGISSLMEIDILKSQDAISDLSSLLRNSLELNKVKFHSIEDEFNLLQHYINIEKIRFDEKLSFKTYLDDDVLNFQIPPLILQPIVENSIKHGFSYNHDTLEVCIKVKKHKSYVIFEIENNGKLLENDDVHFGNGLKNVIERIHTVYKDDCSFKINNTKNNTVLVSLKIPQKTEL